MGVKLATGAAVASTIKASFSREMKSKSVKGRMVSPANKVFA
jgi:hypothetical protein